VAYVVKSGVVTGTIPSPPAAAADRLYLVTLSGLPELRPIYDAMSRMGFYNLSPAVMRVPHPPDAGEILTRDGHNVASVLGRLAVARPEAKHRIEEYLTQVSPGVHGVDRIAVGPMETLEFKQDVVGSRHPWTFGAINMSDGTLRALGVLVALFQGAGPRQESLRLIGIEEPETALHPAASAVLMDVLRDAADERQVLVTSHSPDLLDDASVQDGDIRAVQAEHGDTKIGLLDSAGRAALRDRLYTAGELLRMDQLQPEEAAIELKPEQLRLFGRQD
jgi:predicted ATPase